MKKNRVLVAGILIGSLSLQSGCSFLFVKGPPENHAQLSSFDCSDGNAWPVIDVVWAGLNGLGAASAIGDDTNPDKEQIVGVGMAWLMVSGISAIYGFSKVSKCRDAKRESDPPPYQPLAAPDPATKECLKERRHALAEALRAKDPAERTQLFKAAPMCDTPRAAPVAPAAPASTPPRAPTPTPPPPGPPAPAPAGPPTTSASPTPTTSLSSPRLRAPHRDQPSPPRSLAMRSAQER